MMMIPAFSKIFILGPVFSHNFHLESGFSLYDPAATGASPGHFPLATIIKVYMSCPLTTDTIDAKELLSKSSSIYLMYML